MDSADFTHGLLTFSLILYERNEELKNKKPPKSYDLGGFAGI